MVTIPRRLSAGENMRLHVFTDARYRTFAAAICSTLDTIPHNYSPPSLSKQKVELAQCKQWQHPGRNFCAYWYVQSSLLPVKFYSPRQKNSCEEVTSMPSRLTHGRQRREVASLPTKWTHWNPPNYKRHLAYVCSCGNPADIATRGCSAAEQENMGEWANGTAMATSADITDTPLWCAGWYRCTSSNLRRANSAVTST